MDELIRPVALVGQGGGAQERALMADTIIDKHKHNREYVLYESVRRSDERGNGRKVKIAFSPA